MKVRLSWNGDHIHQLCDPNDGGAPGGRTTGRVRAAVEEFWNDLKRAHFIDSQTRGLIITLPISSNNIGAPSAYRYLPPPTATHRDPPLPTATHRYPPLPAAARHYPPFLAAACRCLPFPAVFVRYLP